MRNVNSFSTAKHLKHKDVRRILYRKQRKERGFDDMVDGLEMYLIDPDDIIAREGIELFYKYFEHLWS